MSRAEECLAHIVRSVERRRRMPTKKELQFALTLKSLGNVDRLLDLLVKRGALVHDPAGTLRFRLTQRSYLEGCIRNVVFNAEQNTSAHSVEELIASLRNALGLKPGERP